MTWAGGRAGKGRRGAAGASCRSGGSWAWGSAGVLCPGGDTRPGTADRDRQRLRALFLLLRPRETRALHPDTGRLVDVRITITGRFLDQEPIDTQLLSLSTLLRSGWRVDLNANVAITAGGYHISLECRDGMWLLPLPARSASALDKQHVLLNDKEAVPSARSQAVAAFVAKPDEVPSARPHAAAAPLATPARSSLNTWGITQSKNVSFSDTISVQEIPLIGRRPCNKSCIMVLEALQVPAAELGDLAAEKEDCACAVEEGPSTTDEGPDEDEVRGPETRSLLCETGAIRIAWLSCSWPRSTGAR